MRPVSGTTSATLASDEFEGRRPGTPGEEQTVAFLIAQYRKLHLDPGNGDSYVQRVPLVEILAGEDATLSAAGRGGTRPLRYGKDMVIWTKRVVPAVQLTQSELVFVGYGIVAPEYEWNDYAQLDRSRQDGARDGRRSGLCAAKIRRCSRATR